MRKYWTSILVTLLIIALSGCSAKTYEGVKAQKRSKERVVRYSPLSGYSYSQPVREVETGPQKPIVDLPEGMRLSYSPLTGESTLVPQNDGRSFPAYKTKRNEVVASYSPITGKSVWRVRD